MDKNKLAEEYIRKIGYGVEDLHSPFSFDQMNYAFLAGFDAAESIANAKIQELENTLTDNFYYQRQEKLEETNINLQLENASLKLLLDSKTKEKEMYDSLSIHTANKITELEQQLKDHRESLRKSVNRSADLSEKLKELADCVDARAVHSGDCQFRLSQHKQECNCYMKLARQYLKSRGE